MRHRELWLLHLRQKGLSEGTLRGYASNLRKFSRHMLRGLDEVSREDVGKAMEIAKENLSPESLVVHVAALRVFFGWMYGQGYVREDPRDWFPRVRKPRRKVRDVPSVGNMKKIILSPDMNSPRGYRDRAMILAQYAGAMRSMELLGMRVGDFDSLKELVKITRKGGDEQVIPVGPLACEYLASYERDIRPQLNPKSDSFWINDRGEAMQEHTYRKWVKKYLHQAGLKAYSSHSFRHAAATHMVLAGAPIHAVSTFLGHKCLQSTEIYTRADLAAVKRAVERMGAIQGV